MSNYRRQTPTALRGEKDKSTVIIRNLNTSQSLIDRSIPQITSKYINYLNFNIDQSDLIIINIPPNNKRAQILLQCTWYIHQDITHFEP